MVYLCTFIYISNTLTHTHTHTHTHTPLHGFLCHDLPPQELQLPGAQFLVGGEAVCVCVGGWVCVGVGVWVCGCGWVIDRENR
jgi:hypothetical protein